jgi:hypothetical protein
MTLIKMKADSNLIKEEKGELPLDPKVCCIGEEWLVDLVSEKCSERYVFPPLSRLREPLALDLPRGDRESLRGMRLD